MEHSIYPCIWFENQAHVAADYYCSIFRNATILSSNPMAVVFEINATKFMALNGNKPNGFNEGVSFVITCDTQEEIDYYWEKLTTEGKKGRCGWVTDKFGVSWQIVPSILGAMMSDPDKAPKTMYAFMQMKKFIISKLLEIQ